MDYISLRQGPINNIFLKHNRDECWVLIRQFWACTLFTSFSLSMGLLLIHSMFKQDLRTFLDGSHRISEQVLVICLLNIWESTNSLHLHPLVNFYTNVSISHLLLNFLHLILCPSSHGPYRDPVTFPMTTPMASLSCLKPVRIPLVPSA